MNLTNRISHLVEPAHDDCGKDCPCCIRGITSMEKIWHDDEAEYHRELGEAFLEIGKLNTERIEKDKKILALESQVAWERSGGNRCATVAMVVAAGLALVAGVGIGLYF